jgi:hypothetical protein
VTLASGALPGLSFDLDVRAHGWLPSLSLSLSPLLPLSPIALSLSVLADPLIELADPLIQSLSFSLSLLCVDYVQG